MAKCSGIIGLGKIGGAVARRGQGFEMEVVAYDPFMTQEQAARMGVRLVPLDELLRTRGFRHHPCAENKRHCRYDQQRTPGADETECARDQLRARRRGQ